MYTNKYILYHITSTCTNNRKPWTSCFSFCPTKHQYLHLKPDTNKYFGLNYVHRSKIICMLSISSIHTFHSVQMLYVINATAQLQICLPSKKIFMMASSVSCLCVSLSLWSIFVSVFYAVACHTRLYQHTSPSIPKLKFPPYMPTMWHLP